MGKNTTRGLNGTRVYETLIHVLQAETMNDLHRKLVSEKAWVSIDTLRRMKAGSAPSVQTLQTLATCLGLPGVTPLVMVAEEDSEADRIALMDGFRRAGE